MKPNVFNEIPCLHRIYVDSQPTGAMKIQAEIGMAISIDHFENMFGLFYEKLINERESNPGITAYITFDDAHKDLLHLKDFFVDYQHITPVAFVTGRQLHGHNEALPLTALYHHCASNNIQLDTIEDRYGFTRQSLKKLPEATQKEILSSKGICTQPKQEDGLNREDLSSLKQSGWEIAYHGPSHSDLRETNPINLRNSLIQDFKLIQKMNYTPWLAWPEGFWNNQIFDIALNVGFTEQFGLQGEQNKGTFESVFDRKIWK